MRTSQDRINNPPGHHYQRDGSIYVCAICGTAEHQNGNYWWAGRYSKIEPPCANNSAGQHDWHIAANES